MGERDSFKVRVSRRLLLVVFLVGVLFLAVGLDLAYLHAVFDANVGSDKPVLFWIFNVFAIAIGALIAVTQGYYLVIPPIMLRVSHDGVSFGTGLRYKQELIPLRYLKSEDLRGAKLD